MRIAIALFAGTFLLTTIAGAAPVPPTAGEQAIKVQAKKKEAKKKNEPFKPQEKVGY